MHLEGISLQRFRAYDQQTFLFPQQTTVVVGNNAAGKTSIIEAIALLSTGESFRADQVEEMVQLEAEYARVKGKVREERDKDPEEMFAELTSLTDENEDQSTQDAERIELEILLTRGMVAGKATQSRLYSVNNVRRRKKDFIGKLFTVVFRPEDMRLVEGSPGRRRSFIDTALGVVDREYSESLKTYEDALKRRNRLLDQVQEGKMPRTVLSYWTSLLIKHGQILQEKRREFFGFFASVQFPVAFQVEYLPSVMSEARMREYAEKEISAGHTLIGPHKDDFEVKFEFGKTTGAVQSVATYGSRGQQRLGVLWLKVCELHFLRTKTQRRPLILLDDILSELDREHREDVSSLLGDGQAIVTTTEEKMLEEIKDKVGEVEVIYL